MSHIYPVSPFPSIIKFTKKETESMGRMFQVNGDHILQYGIEEAFLIGYLQHIIYDHVGKDPYFIDGRHWTYNTTEYFINKLYPFWNERRFNYLIKSLVDQGVIIVGNFNKNKFDRTRWFAFVDEHRFLSELDHRYKKSPENSSSRENAECYSEPKNQNLSPQTVTSLKTVGTNQVMKQDIEEYQSVKTHHPTYKNVTCTAARVSEEKVEKMAPLSNLQKCNISTYKNVTSYIDPLHNTLINFREERLENAPSLKDSENGSKEKKGRGSRLSPTWEIPNEYREWAIQRGLFNEQIDNIADNFKDHWISTTSNATKLDWFATWRKWLRGDKNIRLIEPVSQVKVGVQVAIPVEQASLKKSDNPLIQKWNDMTDEIKKATDARYGEGSYKSWISQLDFQDVTDKCVTFKAPNKFLADHMKTYHVEVLYDFARKIVPSLSNERQIEISYPGSENASR